MSPKAAGLAVKAGYTNVKVYLEGEPAWSKAGLPTYAADGFVEKGNIVLVDLRPKDEAEAARLPRAVSIPFKSLADRMEDIPKKAPVVLYSDDDKEALAALNMLRKEGFKKVSLVAEPEKWLTAPGKHDSGPVVTEVSWQRKPGKGEVTTSDFLAAAAGKKKEAVVLDVRGPEETKDGTFPGAVVIPLDQLGARTGELPRDKKIYIHCSTGARAEMAAKVLREKGYNAFFLVADVECEDNTCEIEE